MFLHIFSLFYNKNRWTVHLFFRCINSIFFYGNNCVELQNLPRFTIKIRKWKILVVSQLSEHHNPDRIDKWFGCVGSILTKEAYRKRNVSFFSFFLVIDRFELISTWLLALFYYFLSTTVTFSLFFRSIQVNIWCQLSNHLKIIIVALNTPLNNLRRNMEMERLLFLHLNEWMWRTSFFGIQKKYRRFGHFLHHKFVIVKKVYQSSWICAIPKTHRFDTSPFNTNQSFAFPYSLAHHLITFKQSDLEPSLWGYHLKVSHYFHIFTIIYYSDYYVKRFVI